MYPLPSLSAGLQAAIDRPDLARGVLLVNPRFRQEHVAEAICGAYLTMLNLLHVASSETSGAVLLPIQAPAVIRPTFLVGLRVPGWDVFRQRLLALHRQAVH